ncbi:MAG: hypothetical protein PHF57_08480 [Methanoregula sp.]|jgi:hypothetical protein|nr:hypothetical protein [Methanoregula sp.]MDD5188230.1 hypothetical protein [Methanoregula sp.]
MDDFVVIIVSVTFTSALWGVILKLFGQGYLDKLNRDWKTKQEREIIELKSSLKKEEEISANLLKLYKSSSDEIQKKRISAASELWDIAMEAQKTASHLSFYDILLDSEYKNPKNQVLIKKISKLLMPEMEYYKHLEPLTIKEKKLRLFVSDETWKIFHVYTGFITRLLFDIYTNVRDNKEIPNWKDNENTKKFLNLAFCDDDLEKIYQMPIGAYGVIFSYLEERMIIEMNKLFSGEYVIRDQKELLKRINDEEPNQILTLNDLSDRHAFQLKKRNF